MEFTNTFSVNAPLDDVWALLMVPEEVTGCVPGAAITEKIDDRHFKGTVKVKLGAVQVSYKGEMEMQPDAASHTIVLSGKGSELRGSGGASGSMTVTLTPEGEGTSVQIESRVDVSGKVATFGRGIMQDVANRLTKQFAACLASKLETPAGAGAPTSETEFAGTQASASSPSPSQETQSTSTAAPAAEPQTLSTTSPPARSAGSPAPPSNEVRIADILMDIARARTASALRSLARWIEPD
jgi:carbon monoxide dehydrogenase subunit G